MEWLFPSSTTPRTPTTQTSTFVIITPAPPFTPQTSSFKLTGLPTASRTTLPAIIPGETESLYMPLIVMPVFGCLPQDTLHQEVSVKKVIDGDTIEVEIEGLAYQVRYIGIDTPESYEPDGELARKANADLVENKTLTLIKDISETDRYDRLLRYVVVDGVFVNYTLVVHGHARVTTYPPDVACESFLLDAELHAREAQLGYWAIPTITPTPDPINAPGFQLISLSSTVRVDGYAQASIRTLPGLECSLIYKTPAGTLSQARGLGSKLADAEGFCQWSWKIGSSTRPGVGQVTISSGGQTQIYSITIQ